jgi:ribosomal protein L29
MRTRFVGILDAMKLSQLATCGCALLLWTGVNTWAAEGTNSAKGSTDIREQLKAMSPAERDAKLKELREPFTRPRPEREQIEKRREELKNLTAAERQAKLKEYRAADTGKTNKVATFSPDERAAKRNALRARLQERIADVRTNTDLKLTEQDRKRFIERMQDVEKTFDKAEGKGAKGLK